MMREPCETLHRPGLRTVAVPGVCLLGGDRSGVRCL